MSAAPEIPTLRSLLRFGETDRHGNNIGSAPEPGRTYAHVAVTNMQRALAAGFHQVGNREPYLIGKTLCVLMWNGSAIPGASDDSTTVEELIDESILASPAEAISKPAPSAPTAPAKIDTVELLMGKKSK